MRSATGVRETMSERVPGTRTRGGDPPGTSGTPDLARLWAVYGLGSALLFSSAPRACIDVRPGGALTLSGEPFVELNWGVINGRPAGDDGESPAPGADDSPAALLRRFAAVVRAERIDAYIMAGSAAAPELEPLASGLGLATSPGPPLMLRRRTGERVFALQQETMTVQRADDDWALRDVAGVLEKAFATPPGVVEHAFPPAVLDVAGLDVFVMRLDGEAASAVVTTRVDEVVGIWAMGTVPGLRGRHLGRRLLEAVIDFHSEAADPPDWFLLTSSTMGRPLYAALDFTVVDETLDIDIPGGHATPD